MSDALVRSLNLPAVQVLEAYGRRLICGKTRVTSACRYICPQRGANLSAFWAAGAQLDEIAAAYAARSLVMGKRRTTVGPADDPLSERPLLMRRGGVDITSTVMADEAQPRITRCRALCRGVENRHQLRLSRCVGYWR